MQLSVQTKAKECHEILSVMIRTSASVETFAEGAKPYTKYARDYMFEDLESCGEFVDIFEDFVAVLDQSFVPKEEALGPALMHCRAIGSIVFELAMNSDAVAGFGPRTLNAELQAGLEKLPECRNDLEYRSVSGMCGYDRVPRGDTVASVRREALDPNGNFYRRTR